MYSIFSTIVLTAVGCSAIASKLLDWSDPYAFALFPVVCTLGGWLANIDDSEGAAPEKRRAGKAS